MLQLTALRKDATDLLADTRSLIFHVQRNLLSIHLSRARGFCKQLCLVYPGATGSPPESSDSGSTYSLQTASCPSVCHTCLLKPTAFDKKGLNLPSDVA